MGYVDLMKLSDKELNNIFNQLIKIRDKKGVVVIMEDDPAITTYNLNSFKRSKRMIGATKK